MKMIVGFFLLFFLMGCGKKMPVSQTATPTPVSNSPVPVESSREDLKREYRRKVVEQSQADMKVSGDTATLEGDKQDVLVYTSSNFTDFKMLEKLKDEFEGFRNLGFTKIVLIDKDKKRREVDLTVLSK